MLQSQRRAGRQGLSRSDNLARLGAGARLLVFDADVEDASDADRDNQRDNECET